MTSLLAWLISEPSLALGMLLHVSLDASSVLVEIQKAASFVQLFLIATFKLGSECPISDIFFG